MHAPKFWQVPKPSALARLLSPLGWCYGAATVLRTARAKPYRANVPVICIGNLSAGGTGKTPVVLDMVERLKKTGMTPHVLSRGYGGIHRGPLRVDPTCHSAHDVGDEPLLLAATAPTWIARDRAKAAKAAERDGAQVLIMDDGFQNPSMVKDLSIIVVDGALGFGNGLCIPAGPLRETVRHGLERADGVIIVGEDVQGIEDYAARHAKAVARCTVMPGLDAAALKGARVLAFAGIGRPAKFFETLRSIGADVVETRGFPDHHPFSNYELDELHRQATALDATLVTTSKDAVRVPQAYRKDVTVLTIGLEWALEKPLTHWLGAVQKLAKQ